MDDKTYYNEVSMSFSAKSENEAFARVCAASFAAALNPTVADITDIKTAVSEAVTNAIIHGYEEQAGMVHMRCVLQDRKIVIEIADDGVGIQDINSAREPLFTSKPELERSGMGFCVMETFMDEVFVESAIGRGTKVTMSKVLA